MIDYYASETTIAQLFFIFPIDYVIIFELHYQGIGANFKLTWLSSEIFNEKDDVFSIKCLLQSLYGCVITCGNSKKMFEFIFNILD